MVRPSYTRVLYDFFQAVYRGYFTPLTADEAQFVLSFFFSARSQPSDQMPGILAFRSEKTKSRPSFVSFVGFLVKAEREFSESEEIAEALCFSL